MSQRRARRPSAMAYAYSEHSRWCSSGTRVCMQSRCLDRLGLFCCHRRDCSGQQHRRGSVGTFSIGRTPDRRWLTDGAALSTGRFRRIEPYPRLPALRALGRQPLCPRRPRGYTLHTSGCRSLSRRPARCNRCHPRRLHSDPHRRQRPPCPHMTRR